MAGRVAFEALGCKVNQYDAEAMMRLFRLAGWEIVPFTAGADVYIVDTCSVTGRAAAKSRQALRQAARRNPAAITVAAGCSAQTVPGSLLQLPQLALVLGNQERGRVVELVEELLAARSLGNSTLQANAVAPILRTHSFEETPIEGFSGHTRAPLKVQEGCDMFCSYCIIPFARGPSRSRPEAAVLAEAGRLVAAGFRELILTGIHLGSYGKDLPGGPDLTRLLHRLHDVPGLERIRLSSLEPMHVTPELMELLAESAKLMPHLHLSLQSGADPVLRRMRRSYSSEEYRQVVLALRRRLPQLGLSTDVMVGFPGETAALFEESLRFVKEMSFSRLHVFPFSSRQGTAAARLGGSVPNAEKERRAERMIDLGRHLAEVYAQRLVNQVSTILVEMESPLPGLLAGYTPEYVRVVFPGPESLKGRLAPVRITRAGAEQCQGELATWVSPGSPAA